MLGVHFAVTADQERLLLGGDDAAEELLMDIEENWADPDLSMETDKAWDALHRCFGDGTLDPDGGAYPLSHAILGGRHLHDEYYVVHVTAAEVRDVADALQRVEKAWLRDRFDSIDDPDYLGPQDDTDFEYTWSNFVDVRGFYERAAKAGRAVVFTAT
ncbi:YfbM family protein [Actinocrispum wychmicini]|uniref:Uncharacterized protein DUF1877 n=1 Tax=Actinocrispum wychmicini TaxID=1213861 RepID=A0A4R2JSV4_9PSEU|nr:YfbM family protein [Actinocrispum wychmicini]TCO62704.1 uncharacterized protein DUF1877 [Actinocrispum wychmicini]